MPTHDPLGTESQRATDLLRREIQKALDQQEELARRALLDSGAHFDRAYLVRLRTQLRQLAQQKSIEITTGRFGDMIEQAAKKGYEAVPGATFAEIDKGLVDLALSNAEIRVKDMLDAGGKFINEEVTKGIVSGKSLSDISDALRQGLDLGYKDKGVPEWRADLIAQSELHSVYRQAQVKAGDDMGFTYYSYEGPLDDKTTPICTEYVGEVRTKDEWKEISAREQGDPDIIFMYGLHYGCRHTLIPVPDNTESTVGRRREEEEPEDQQQQAPIVDTTPEAEPLPTTEPEPEAPEKITLANFKVNEKNPEFLGHTVFVETKNDPTYKRMKQDALAAGQRAVLPVPKDMDKAEFKEWTQTVLGTTEVEPAFFTVTKDRHLRDYAEGVQEMFRNTGMDPNLTPALERIGVKRLDDGSIQVGGGACWSGPMLERDSLSAPRFPKNSIEFGEPSPFVKWDSDRGGFQISVKRHSKDPRTAEMYQPMVTRTHLTGGKLYPGELAGHHGGTTFIHENGHHLTYTLPLDEAKEMSLAFMDPGAMIRTYENHKAAGSEMFPCLMLQNNKPTASIAAALSRYAGTDVGEAMAEALVIGVRYGWDYVPAPVRAAWAKVIAKYGGAI